MGYKEEIFQRLEMTGLRDKKEIADWLAGPKRSASSYSNFAIQLQEPFAIREEIEKSKDFRELARLKNDAIGTEINETVTIKMIDERIKVVRREDLKKKGKTSTLYRDELKSAKSPDELESILERALEDLGEGKNYDSLVGASEILKGRLV